MKTNIDADAEFHAALETEKVDSLSSFKKREIIDSLDDTRATKGAAAVVSVSITEIKKLL